MRCRSMSGERDAITEALPQARRARIARCEDRPPFGAWSKRSRFGKCWQAVPAATNLVPPTNEF
jgi:hypothetical protein